MTYAVVCVLACQLHTRAYRVGDVVQRLGQGVNTPERGYTDVGHICTGSEQSRARRRTERGSDASRT
jgi:hypothetical protein